MKIQTRKEKRQEESLVCKTSSCPASFQSSFAKATEDILLRQGYGGQRKKGGEVTKLRKKIL
jgi:hypothetical protein